METANQDADPTIDPTGDPVADPSVANGEGASDIYNADAPPFPELPESPKKAPSMPGGSADTTPVDASGANRHLWVRVGAAVLGGLLAVVFLRRRRDHRSGPVGRRVRRS